MTTSMSERSSVETGGRITFAWRVVSVTYMSTATHHSSVSIASSRRAPPGVESTGLPAKIEHAADLALARRRDLVRQAGDRQLAVHLRHPADALRVAAVVAEAEQPGALEHRGDVERRVGEHRAAGDVEVAGDGVEHVDEPVRQRAGPLLAHADPPVRDRPLGVGELARQPFDRRLVDARDRRRARDRPVRGKRLDRGDPVGVALEVTEPRAALREQHVQHPEQQVGIAAGGDRDVLGGVRRGLGAARVDDHDGAAARDDRAQPVTRARRRHERPVRHRRVRAEHEHVVGAVEVGDREQREVPEHLGRRQVLRQLVGSTSPSSGCACRARGGASARTAPPSCARSGCRSRWPPRRCRGAAAPPRNPSAARSSASSQPISSHSEPTRRTGRRSRSGSAYRSASAAAFGQM